MTRGSKLSAAKETDERAYLGQKRTSPRAVTAPARRMLTKWILSRPETPALTVRQSPL